MKKATRGGEGRRTARPSKSRRTAYFAQPSPDLATLRDIQTCAGGRDTGFTPLDYLLLTYAAS